MGYRDITSLVTDIAKELKAAVEKSMDGIEQYVPGAIQKTFDTSGTRGGNVEWEQVPFGWIMRRKSFPGGPMNLKDYHAQGGKLTPDQESYYRNAKPLIDTGALRNSIQVMDRSMQGFKKARMVIGSPLEYAAQHDQGVPGEIRQRPFNHLVDEDLRNVNGIVERAFAS